MAKRVNIKDIDKMKFTTRQIWPANDQIHYAKVHGKAYIETDPAETKQRQIHLTAFISQIAQACTHLGITIDAKGHVAQIKKAPRK